MAKDPFKKTLKEIDREQRIFVLKAMGLPLPKEVIQNTKTSKYPSVITNSLSFLFNGTLFSSAAIAASLHIGLIETNALDISMYGICSHQVTTDGVNVRSGPGTTYPSVIRLADGTRVSSLGFSPDANGRPFRWMHVDVTSSDTSQIHYIREDNITQLTIPSPCRNLRK